MMKLVIHDRHSAAGLILPDVDHMRDVVRALRGLETVDSASVLLEAFARRCLEAGVAFDSTDPLTACSFCTRLVEVEVHAEDGASPVQFVRLYDRDADGILCRRHHGTLHAVARQLRCEDGAPFPTLPAIATKTAAFKTAAFTAAIPPRPL
ncbi:hypothetical protein [Azospirillum brasilense]|uniref:Uncharacterized protein n=1 Tax=Azospirillum brasilense TaxID=192 RepID=A0A235HCJ0_AZOBR|nr:hypothetical protein [Azospirillum brasilense]OYD83227.1 hypothetical protein CHT98_16350 [Azospirillum brasilense]